MTVQDATRAMRERLAQAESDRDAWRASGPEEKYLGAGAPASVAGNRHTMDEARPARGAIGTPLDLRGPLATRFEVAEALLDAWARIDAVLTPIIGRGGVQALYRGAAWRSPAPRTRA